MENITSLPQTTTKYLTEGYIFVNPVYLWEQLPSFRKVDMTGWGEELDMKTKMAPHKKTKFMGLSKSPLKFICPKMMIIIIIIILFPLQYFFLWLTTALQGSTLRQKTSMIPSPFLICKLEKSVCALPLGYLPFFQWRDSWRWYWCSWKFLWDGPQG